MNNIQKGYEYELYINNYLNTLDNIKIAYLWKDISEYLLFDYGFIKSYNDHRLQRKTNNINKLEDIGSDIIYINQNDECIIIQCKNYTKAIKIEDLSGFFFIMCKHIDKIGEIYYTNKLSKKILNEYNDDERIKLIRKEIIHNNNNIINIIKPYDYQNNIIKLAEEYYKDYNSGIISCPCGTGKTLISCYIAMNYNIVIMITPLKQYAKQNCDRFKIYENDRNSLLIDSDGTRDLKDINEFIKNNSKILLSVTYKSCDIICEIINQLENVFIIFDEFHNFSYNNIYEESDNIYKLINSESDNIKKLYLSATPRIYELEDNNDIDVNEIFGDYIYKMSFNEAIDNKYISDYELYLPIFSNDSESNLEINNLNIHENYLLKLQFLIEALKMQGNLKVIVYIRTHEEIDTFISEFNKLNEYYKYDVDINKITCNDSYTNRSKILDDFNNSNKINILLSVHILDEAIDIPSCNSIYMTYVSSSKIKNIQRMSRAMRYQNNKIAKIFLFCKDIDESISYISSIREYDTDFIKKINYLEVSDKIKSKKERLQISNENVEENKIKILGIKLYRSENWNEMLEKVKKYIDENNKRPSSTDQNKEIKLLGVWICYQSFRYKNNNEIMKYQDIYNNWLEFINNDKYKIYFKVKEANTIIWINRLEEVKNYINKNNKKPSTSDKNQEIQKLAYWVTRNFRYYKYRNYIMKHKIIYYKFTEFINDNKYNKYYYWGLSFLTL
jgi:superfamily II DNA or RNA helicase